MNEVQIRAITEMFLKVMGNQALIMIALASITEVKSMQTALETQAMKLTKENNEAIDFLKKTATAQ